MLFAGLVHRDLPCGGSQRLLLYLRWAGSAQTGGYSKNII